MTSNGEIPIDAFLLAALGMALFDRYFPILAVHSISYFLSLIIEEDARYCHPVSSNECEKKVVASKQTKKVRFDMASNTLCSFHESDVVTEVMVHALIEGIPRHRSTNGILKNRLPSPIKVQEVRNETKRTPAPHTRKPVSPIHNECELYEFMKSKSGHPRAMESRRRTMERTMPRARKQL